MELDSGDYNTLNKKYLAELKKYEDTQQYVNSDSIDYATTATQMLQNSLASAPLPTNIKGQYVDDNPSLMVGANDKKLYYFDSSSGTLTDMPLSSNQVPVSQNDLTTILQSNKVNKTDIQSLINQAFPSTTMPLSTLKSSVSLPNSLIIQTPIISSTPSTTVAGGIYNSVGNALYNLTDFGSSTNASITKTTNPNVTSSGGIYDTIGNALYNLTDTSSSYNPSTTIPLITNMQLPTKTATQLPTKTPTQIPTLPQPPEFLKAKTTITTQKPFQMGTQMGTQMATKSKFESFSNMNSNYLSFLIDLLI
jgi:hypothetical protein